jgi:hypothetical protein
MFQEPYGWARNAVCSVFSLTLYAKLLVKNLYIHSCTKEIEVLLDTKMAEILAESLPEDPSVATQFDCWIHSHLYDPQAITLGYNAV